MPRRRGARAPTYHPACMRIARKNGVCLVLTEPHFQVAASVGAHPRSMAPTTLTLDTGAATNLIRRDALPEGWEAKRVALDEAKLPKMGDANGRPIPSSGVVELRTRIGRATYRVHYLVVDKLVVEAIVGTPFLRRHVDAIRCHAGRVDFRCPKARVPILQQGTL